MPLAISKRETDPHKAMSLCLWREGRGELARFGPIALVAIAWVVANRVRHNRTDTVTEVYRPLAFSSMTAPGDPQLFLYPQSDDDQYPVCQRIADEVMKGTMVDPVDGAILYWNPAAINSSRVITLPDGRLVPFPRTWNPGKVRIVRTIGHHVFAQELP